MHMQAVFGGTSGSFAVPDGSTSPFHASPFRNGGQFENMNPFDGGDFGNFGDFPRGLPFSGMESVIGAIFVGMLVFWLAVTVILSLISLVSMWKLFRKAGQPGWKSIIPVYNLYVMLKISGCPGWWLVLYFIPYVNLIVAVLAADTFVKAYGRLGIGPVLMYVFLAPFYLPYLAFSRNVRYMGPFPWGSGFYGGPANAYGDPLGMNVQPGMARSGYAPTYPQGPDQGQMPPYGPVSQPMPTMGYMPVYSPAPQPASNMGNLPVYSPAPQPASNMGNMSVYSPAPGITPLTDSPSSEKTELPGAAVADPVQEQNREDSESVSP